MFYFTRFCFDFLYHCCTLLFFFFLNFCWLVSNWSLYVCLMMRYHWSLDSFNVGMHCHWVTVRCQSLHKEVWAARTVKPHWRQLLWPGRSAPALSAPMKAELVSDWSPGGAWAWPVASQWRPRTPLITRRSRLPALFKGTLFWSANALTPSSLPPPPSPLPSANSSGPSSRRRFTQIDVVIWKAARA